MTDLALDEIPFIVIDVETTGFDPRKNRIFDVACVLVRGGEILEEFSSLVNPEQFIPPYIANMTGISNARAFSAPKSEDVFPEVARFLAIPNAVFVAHNLQFDWSFISQTLEREGLEFPRSMPRLCTLKLAKRLLPRHKRLGLDALVEYYNIQVESRHRALSDSQVTAQVLSQFLELLEEHHDIHTGAEILAFQNKRLDKFRALPKPVRELQSTLAELPEEPGVYYFYDQNGDIIYIGKAKRLSDRVHSYFHQGADHAPKIVELVRQVRKITWECTGTELSALLYESKKIKEHRPRYNTLIKRYRRYPFLRLGSDDGFPRLEWRYEIEDDGAEYFGPFGSRGSAEAVIDVINRAFQLRECADSLTPSKDFSPCFFYQIKRCAAPCALLQSREEYLQEVDFVRGFLSGEESGIIALLSQKMEGYSERLEFEEAIVLRNRIKELRRIFYRQQQIATSVNANNVIIILPTSRKTQKAEVFFVHYGRLAFQRLTGIRFPVKEFSAMIEKVYFDGSTAPKYCRKEEIDEIRIIASWIHQHRDDGKFIYTENRSPEEIADILKVSIEEVLSEVKKKGGK